MSLAARVVLLVTLWLLAWGDASIANLASGTVLAAVLLIAFPSARRHRAVLRFRPVGIGRLGLYIVTNLVTSNLLMTREVLSRRSRVRTGVLAYPLRHPSDEALSLLASVLALSPGTMTVEVTRTPPVIYVHFLLLEDVDHARQQIARLEALIVGAIGAASPGNQTQTTAQEPT